MSDYERHHEPDGAQLQFREYQQTGQEGQPEIDRTSIDDERATQQRSDVPVGQVVQVGAGALNDDVACVRAERRDGEADDK